jgi:methyl-accepting chemotaxis protein
VYFLNRTAEANLVLLESNLRTDYDRLVQAQVTQAHSMLTALVKERDSGALKPEEALRLGANLLRGLNYGKDTYFWADTYDGVNVVLLGGASEGKPRWDLQDAKGKYMVRDIIAAARQPGGGYVDYWFPRPGQTEPAPKRSYALAFEPFQWSLGSGNYVDDIESALKAYRGKAQAQLVNDSFVVLVLLVLGVALAAGMALLLGRRIGRPLIEVDAALRRLAEGDADLTVHLPVRTGDEVGRVATSFNAFTGNLRSLLTTVRSSMDSLKNTGADLSANATETASATHEIAANIESVGNLIGTQAASITETSATVEEIGKTFQSFHKMIETQAAEVQSSTKSLEAMVDDVVGLVGEVDRASGQFKKLEDDSRAGTQKMQDVESAVVRIMAQSQNLDETNLAIASIAGQTNLLAMNAAIEAAHAGQAGRGFIEEVRKASRAAGDVFALISGQVPQVVALQSHLQKTLEEQAGENRKVLTMFQAIQRLSQEIRGGSSEMEEGTKTILDEMNRLVRISQEVQGSMAEIGQGTTEINTAIHAISTLSVGTKDSIDEVDRITQRFKL